MRTLARDPDRRAFAIESVLDSIRHRLDALDLPAYVTGRRWDVLGWNAAAEEIFSFEKGAAAFRIYELSGQ